MRSLSYSQDAVVKSLVEELREQRRANTHLQEKMDAERRQWQDEKHLLAQQKYEAERERDDVTRRLQYEADRCVISLLLDYSCNVSIRNFLCFSD